MRNTLRTQVCCTLWRNLTTINKLKSFLSIKSSHVTSNLLPFVQLHNENHSPASKSWSAYKQPKAGHHTLESSTSPVCARKNCLPPFAGLSLYLTRRSIAQNQTLQLSCVHSVAILCRSKICLGQKGLILQCDILKQIHHRHNSVPLFAAVSHFSWNRANPSVQDHFLCLVVISQNLNYAYPVRTTVHPVVKFPCCIWRIHHCLLTGKGHWT